LGSRADRCGIIVDANCLLAVEVPHCLIMTQFMM
jgi:hypothetical protein